MEAMKWSCQLTRLRIEPEMLEASEDKTTLDALPMTSLLCAAPRQEILSLLSHQHIYRRICISGNFHLSHQPARLISGRTASSPASTPTDDQTLALMIDSPASTHYQVLGLKPSAKKADIKKQFFKLTHLYHPDKVAAKSSSDCKEADPSHAKMIQARFVRLSQAYKVLSDENSRFKYDQELSLTDRPLSSPYHRTSSSSSPSFASNPSEAADFSSPIRDFNRAEHFRAHYKIFWNVSSTPGERLKSYYAHHARYGPWGHKSHRENLQQEEFQKRVKMHQEDELFDQKHMGMALITCVMFAVMLIVGRLASS